MDCHTALAFSTLEQLGQSLLPESTLDELAAYFDKAQTILKNQQTPLILTMEELRRLDNLDSTSAFARGK